MNESTLVPREEMNDLDWLARNVHAWPAGDHQPWCYVYMVAGGAMKAAGNFLDAVAKPTMITIDQWLARRAELQNKPSWVDAPKWAVYMAQSPKGHWEFFSAKPIAYNWWRHPLDVKSKANDASKTGLILGDWRDTIEKRPDANEMQGGGISESMQELRKKCGFDPLNSMEDAAPTTQPFSQKVSVDGVEYLITSASTSVNPSCAATAKQPAPKGSGNPILGMVLADLTNRALEGKEKYGEPLLAHNGRNPLWDAYQEALDLAMYLRQAIEEQK